MRYVGGKGRIAKVVAETIRARTLAETIYEPFLGGGAMTAALAPHFDEVLAGDGHEDIALMWQAVLSGWVPPAVTYERYQELRYATEPSAERGFAGAGGSFGGRWFEGFARGGFNANGEPRNHQAESVRAVLRDRDNMMRGRVHVFHKDYRAWPLDCGEPSAIYCDPPYAASARAKRYAVGFDSAEFWEWAETQSESHDVFVSEYEAPPRWGAVWEGTKRQSLVIGSGTREMRTERLFIFQGKDAR
ncbi:DNA adenine methylase [Leucobacter luti]|uniref:DNA adenine methylase n=1 Tax=Leucobacter luti TaxID=340320 RepID=UPI001C68A5DF|nr:DNA adenine methylase [Leucobacter luti]QYM76913.1 DNA adenine methylase [Leucobacter luti]